MDSLIQVQVSESIGEGKKKEVERGWECRPFGISQKKKLVRVIKIHFKEILKSKFN